ncbi:MAG: hypothetical protein MUO80_07025 [Dehalococcoidia bacterium]|nr:hypothetical protein [Dehalococcoidia bacterium]
METQDIHIPPVRLKWSEWASWNDLMRDARSGGIRIPTGKPGVYEVRLEQNLERLTIGKASDLRMRIRQGLIKGKTQHSAGKRIRANEDVSKIEIRWAETDRPSAVEEELHKQYLAHFGEWPRYTDHT